MAKKVFTTGEVARLLGININTVIKWFDDGEIDGFRLPNGSGRRIPLASLLRFMSFHGIPYDLLEESTPMRRRHRRVNCEWHGRVSVVNGHEYGPYEAHISDVSLGGARIRVVGQTLSIPMGEHTVTLGLSDGPLSGTVMHGRIAHLAGHDDGLTVGVEFHHLGEEETSRIEHFVETHA